MVESPVNIMNITPKQLENFGSVWQQLLKQKVNIIYQISQHKKVNFEELLKEFIPEALDYKSLWEDNYLVKSETKQETKPKLLFKKTIDNKVDKSKIKFSKKLGSSLIDKLECESDDSVLTKKSFKLKKFITKKCSESDSKVSNTTSEKKVKMIFKKK